MGTVSRAVGIIGSSVLVGVAAVAVYAQSMQESQQHAASAVDQIAPPSSAEHLWAWVVPGATPRPGAQIAGPIRIAGALSLTQAEARWQVIVKANRMAQAIATAKAASERENSTIVLSEYLPGVDIQ
jgi:hypothetical protein